VPRKEKRDTTSPILGGLVDFFSSMLLLPPQTIRCCKCISYLLTLGWTPWLKTAVDDDERLGWAADDGEDWDPPVCHFFLIVVSPLSSL
jgi:hypothetical protein